MKKKILLIALAVSLILPACKTITGNPIIIRAEQTETITLATFDAMLKIDDSNRAFYKSNLPQFHDFCEWLRVLIKVNQTNSMPRGAALCYSLNQVKLAYKSGLTTSNAVITAIAATESALAQAQNWLSQINTNK
jgi:hypothetical protein